MFDQFLRVTLNYRSFGAAELGYASRGVLRGTVAVPIRLEDGTLSGYIGITEAKQPPKWET